LTFIDIVPFCFSSTRCSGESLPQAAKAVSTGDHSTGRQLTAGEGSGESVVLQPETKGEENDATHPQRGRRARGRARERGQRGREQRGRQQRPAGDDGRDGQREPVRRGPLHPRGRCGCRSRGGCRCPARPPHPRRAPPSPRATPATAEPVPPPPAAITSARADAAARVARGSLPSHVVPLSAVASALWWAVPSFTLTLCIISNVYSPLKKKKQQQKTNSTLLKKFPFFIQPKITSFYTNH
jgi:hypothetical protein